MIIVLWYIINNRIFNLKEACIHQLHDTSKSACNFTEGSNIIDGAITNHRRTEGRGVFGNVSIVVGVEGMGFVGNPEGSPRKSPAIDIFIDDLVELLPVGFEWGEALPQDTQGEKNFNHSL